MSTGGLPDGEYKRCKLCGKTFRPRHPSAIFCQRECYSRWWTLNAQKEIAAKGTARLKELRDSGNDPSHGGEAARKRSKKIAESNRLKPRRSKKPSANSEHRTISQPRAVPDDYAGDELNLYEESVRVWDDRSTRIKNQGTITLTGHGASIRVEDGVIKVKHGATQPDKERRIDDLYPGISGVKRIVCIDPSGYLTFDALKKCATLGIGVIILNRYGLLLSAIPNDTPANVHLRRAQYTLPEEGRIEIGRDILKRKLTGQISTLRKRPLFVDTVPEKRLEDHLSLLDSVASIGDMLTIEASAANSYFEVLAGTPVRWKGREAKKVAPHWREMRGRVSPLSGKNRHAVDPANALLNYSYGVLAGDVRLALAATGFDPACGILHADRTGRESLVYDLMEIFRAEADLKILSFLNRYSFTRGDFILTTDGRCAINPSLAACVVKQVSLDSRRIEQETLWLRDRVLDWVPITQQRDLKRNQAVGGDM